MMGTQPSEQQPALFSYFINLERRIPADHLLRQINAKLDLSYVLPLVRPCYGRSGNVSVDPRVIVKMMLLLFLYNIRSERELMEQISVRMDFLWFLGLDLETPVPDHSVLSKARARWGCEVFEKLFGQTVRQCVEAGLVDGSLLHVDSTMVKANASRDSVVPSGPDLVKALREAYQQQESKLQVVSKTVESPTSTDPVPSSSEKPVAVEAQNQPSAPTGEPEVQNSQPESGAKEPVLRVLGRPAKAQGKAQEAKPAAKRLPVNMTHISTTDPEAELARSKNGVTELNHKEHRLVDDTHGVITAVAATTGNVADGKKLPDLYEQHLLRTGLERPQVAIAGDHHYGTAENFIYCSQQDIRAHLGAWNSSVEERGQLPPSQFVYEAAKDRLRCPQGHYLVLHQKRPEKQAKGYLIEDQAHCAACPLREQCTNTKRGRSILRHDQAELLEKARVQSNSPTALYHRKRRQHVMEGSFADAVNNHGAKKARWRGLWRQKIQSWMIATVQNLRILLRNEARRPLQGAGIITLNRASGTEQTLSLSSLPQSGLSTWVKLAH